MRRSLENSIERSVNLRENEMAGSSVATVARRWMRCDWSAITAHGLAAVATRLQPNESSWLFKCFHSIQCYVHAVGHPLTSTLWRTANRDVKLSANGAATNCSSPQLIQARMHARRSIPTLGKDHLGQSRLSYMLKEQRCVRSAEGSIPSSWNAVRD